jgi:transcriptional regulator with XRE-family HTH domain
MNLACPVPVAAVKKKRQMKTSTPHRHPIPSGVLGPSVSANSAQASWAKQLVSAPAAPAPAPAGEYPAPVRESPDATLAKNLVVARQAANVTQHALAAAALVSRATVAQIETGCSDPRLSTIVDLARALGVPPYFLLVGPEEVNALMAMPAALAERPLRVPPGELERMQRLIRSGMLKDRVRAARIGVAIASDAGRTTPAAAISAAIFSAIQPTGISVGTVLGELAAPGPDRPPNKP